MTYIDLSFRILKIFIRSFQNQKRPRIYFYFKYNFKIEEKICKNYVTPNIIQITLIIHHFKNYHNKGGKINGIFLTLGGKIKEWCPRVELPSEVELGVVNYVGEGPLFYLPWLKRSQQDALCARRGNRNILNPYFLC